MSTCCMQLAILILLTWIGPNAQSLRPKRVNSGIMANNTIDNFNQCGQSDLETSRDNPPVLSDALSASSTSSSLQAINSLQNTLCKVFVVVQCIGKFIGVELWMVLYKGHLGILERSR